jgi:hypothetical protein
MSEPGLTPFFDTIMRDNLVFDNIFAFYMSMNPDEDDSELTIGSYNEERFVGELNWHPVVDQLFWSLRLEDVKIAGVSLNLCADR